MKFISTNEIDRFRFTDCIVNEIENSDSALRLTVTALIVCANNSQNTNYTESYADEAVIEFGNARINKITKEGYKRYDANDNLLEEVADEDMPVDSFDIKRLENNYLISVEKTSENECMMEVELMDEDPSAITDVYELILNCGDITVSWDRYLNKVSQY